MKCPEKISHSAMFHVRDYENDSLELLGGDWLLEVRSWLSEREHLEGAQKESKKPGKLPFSGAPIREF